MEREYINSLIQCNKTVIVAPKKEMYIDKKSIFTLRNDFTCVSDDGTKQFEVFMRNNISIPNKFSIGLNFHSDKFNVTLCRYNGKQEHKNKYADHNKFNNFHIHKLYDNQLSGECSKIIDAEATTKYHNFTEALYHFLIDCHIVDWKKYFPDLEERVNQISFETYTRGW